MGAIARRDRGWVLELLYGVSALVLGAVAVSWLPESGMWLIGTLVGIEILLRGMTIAATGFSVMRAGGSMFARTPRPAR